MGPLTHDQEGSESSDEEEEETGEGAPAATNVTPDAGVNFGRVTLLLMLIFHTNAHRCQVLSIICSYRPPSYDT